MTWAHLLDATIFIVGTLVGFAAAVWVLRPAAPPTPATSTSVTDTTATGTL